MIGCAVGELSAPEAVIPAKAGIQNLLSQEAWIPALHPRGGLLRLHQEIKPQ